MKSLEGTLRSFSSGFTQVIRIIFHVSCLTAITHRAVLGRPSAAPGRPATLSEPSDASRDFCMHEAFNASCSDGSVILMASALYGRMKTGRCITGIFNIGCSKDVIGYMDSQCSVRQACDVSIRQLVEIHPCQKDFTSYLQASYTCIPVTGFSESACPKEGRFLVEGPRGYVSGTLGKPARPALTLGSMVGQETCPWVLRAKRGQRLKISVILIHDRHQSAGSALKLIDEQVKCSAKFHITEGDTTQHLAIASPLSLQQTVQAVNDVTMTSLHDVCVAGKPRHRELYESRGHVVTVYLSRDARDKQKTELIYPRFILQYEAQGCPRLDVPRNAWLRPMGESVMVRCNDTMESTTWYLTCQDNVWIGDIGNCTPRTERLRNVENQTDQFSSNGLVLAVLIGVILGLFIGMLLLLLMLCSRTKSRSRQSFKLNSSHSHASTSTAAHKLLRYSYQAPSCCNSGQDLLQRSTSPSGQCVPACRSVEGQDDTGIYCDSCNQLCESLYEFSKTSSNTSGSEMTRSCCYPECSKQTSSNTFKHTSRTTNNISDNIENCIVNSDLNDLISDGGGVQFRRQGVKLWGSWDEGTGGVLYTRLPTCLMCVKEQCRCPPHDKNMEINTQNSDVINNCT